MTKRRLALVAVVLAAALLAGRWLYARVQRHEALRLADAGRFAEAEPLLRKALARDAGDAEVLAALALGSLAASEAGAAEEYLSRWCELRPDEARPHRLRMDLRHRTARAERGAAGRLRRMGEALADGRRVLELEPGNDEVRREVVWLLLQVGQFDEAARDCRRCLERAPDDPWLLYLLARACHARGDGAEAEAHLDRALRAGPHFSEAVPETLVLRAALHREAGRPERAVPLLRQALTLARCPRKECLYQLGLALAAAGQPEARRALAEAQLLGLEDALADQLPNTAAVRVQVAEAMLGAGRPEEARSLLESVLAEEPDFVPAHRVLADYFEQKGQPERAAEHRRKMTR